MAKTNSAANAKLQYEAGQELNPMAAMTDSGDHKAFSTDASLWSQKSGYEPIVRPDGLETGGAVTPGSANDKVAVAALTCYLAGVKKTVPADGAVSVTRPTGGSPPNTHNISSITINSAGTIAVVKGTDGTSHSITRGAGGGPPLIPVGSIEIAQVKLSSSASAAITAAEIFQVVGSSCERWDYPIWEEDPFNGKITFASALPAVHEGSPATVKGVYAEVYEPIFTDIEPASDFKPPENTHSTTSTQVYGGTVGASSSSLGQGSFKVFLKDGVTDPFVGLKNEILFFKFFPDRNKTPYIIVQGKLGIARTFPAGDNIQADCTISATQEAVDVAG